MTAIVTPLTPSHNSSIKGESSTSHAVSRSGELLSCAKTALKIGKAQHANEDHRGGTTWWACQEPDHLALCSWKDEASNSELDGLCEDGLSLLRTMDVELTQLETLVRRRGHTNDPTEEIAASVRRLETDAKELSSLVKTGFTFPRATSQYQRHTQLIASWLESVANQQMAKLKEILKVRGNVLADQAQRRKLLNPQGPGNNGNSNDSRAAATTPMSMMEQKKIAPKAINTPLFTMTPLPNPSTYTNGHYQNGSAPASATAATNAYDNNYYAKTPAANTNTTTPAYARTIGGYGGGPSTMAGGGYGGYGAAYGGRAGGPATTGMRQLRTKASLHHNNNNANDQEEEAAQIQMRIQQRQQQRQTESRLQEAQQAERTLAELGTMFTKMTSLISQQGEVLEKVEDDVEAGLSEVTAGQQEITKLYALKKGNRALILKLFGLLIFLIIFMRLYKK